MKGSNFFAINGMVIGLVLASNSLQAQETQIGVKAGKMVAGLSGYDFSDATNIGFVFSGRSFEAEFTTTTTDGETEGFFDATWNVTTLAAYGVYRSDSSPYFKLKGGLLYEDVTIDTSFVSVSENDIGLSLGAGIGWNMDSGNKLELEMTMVEADINYISLSFLF